MDLFQTINSIPLTNMFIHMPVEHWLNYTIFVITVNQEV